MKAAFLVGERAFAIRELPEPATPGDGFGVAGEGVWHSIVATPSTSSPRPLEPTLLGSFIGTARDRVTAIRRSPSWRNDYVVSGP
jgi:hypothetical protein